MKFYLIINYWTLQSTRIHSNIYYLIRPTKPVCSNFFTFYNLSMSCRTSDHFHKETVKKLCFDRVHSTIARHYQDTVYIYSSCHTFSQRKVYESITYQDMHTNTNAYIEINVYALFCLCIHLHTQINVSHLCTFFLKELVVTFFGVKKSAATWSVRHIRGESLVN